MKFERWYTIREIRDMSDTEEVDRLRAKKKQIHEDLEDSVKREWVGLTHDEILDSLAPSYEYVEKEFFSIVRSLEAKLKEKNT